MSPPLEIRHATQADRRPITLLYNHFVRETAITFDTEPFTVEERGPWFDAFSVDGRYQLFAAVEDERVLGYAASLRFRPKAAYETSIETSIYLAPEAHGRGIGTRLYETLFEALRGQDLRRALAGVTLPNDASIALHRRFGFESVGTFHEVGRKQGRYWDVAWFEKQLG